MAGKRVNSIFSMVTLIVMQLINCAAWEAAFHRSGDCEFEVTINWEFEAKYYVDPSSGIFNHLDITYKALGNSNPNDWEYRLSGGGMKEYVGKKGNKPLLNCATDWEKYSVRFDYGDLKDEAGSNLQFLPATMKFGLYYKPSSGNSYSDEKLFNPSLQNGCKTSVPSEEPGLTVGKFNNDFGECCCTLTIGYSPKKDWVYEIWLYEDTMPADTFLVEKKLNDLQGRNITSELSRSGTTNQWVYKWVNTSSGNNRLFQIRYRQKSPPCTMSDEKSGDFKPLENITCSRPVVEIRNIKDKKSNPINIGIDSIALKTVCPCTTYIYARLDDMEKPDTVKVEISYDTTIKADSAMINFYRTRRPGTNIVKTIVVTPSTKSVDCIYKVPWDGRDSIDNRLLLAGSYKVKATVKFSNGSNSHTVGIRIAQPNFVNLPVDYPGSDQNWVDSAVSHFRRGLYDFNRVGFLRPVDTLFEWLRCFTHLSNNVDVKSYNKINLGDSIRVSDTIIDTIQQMAALFSFVGHASASSEPFRSTLLFTGNRLYPECTEDGYESACDAGNICLDYRCNNGAYRGGNVFDDVLLAVLLGCRTMVGNPAIAEEVTYHGADCVIGTKVKVHPLVVNFLYRNFMNELMVKKKTIENALKDGFDSTINNIKAFYTQIPDTASFEDVKNHLRTFDEIVDGDTLTWDYLYDWDETFEILDYFSSTEAVSQKSILPARFGAKSTP